jgi:hypothetical protein
MIEKRAVELTNSRSDSRFRLDSILWKREMLDRGHSSRNHIGSPRRNPVED